MNKSKVENGEVIEQEKRFLDIWNLTLNEDTFRYENGYWYVDYLLVKHAERTGTLKELSFELSEMQRPHLKDMD